MATQHYTNGAPIGTAFVRNFAVPIDKSSLLFSIADLEAYIQHQGGSGSPADQQFLKSYHAYPGQIVTVVDSYDEYAQEGPLEYCKFTNPHIYVILKTGPLIEGENIKDRYIEITKELTPGGSYTLPVASSSKLGGIKIGAGLNITGDGTLSNAISFEESSVEQLA